jgi:hypothetical protein
MKRIAKYLKIPETKEYCLSIRQVLTSRGISLEEKKEDQL